MGDFEDLRDTVCKIDRKPQISRFNSEVLQDLRVRSDGGRISQATSVNEGLGERRSSKSPPLSLDGNGGNDEPGKPIANLVTTEESLKAKQTEPPSAECVDTAGKWEAVEPKTIQPGPPGGVCLTADLQPLLAKNMENFN